MGRPLLLYVFCGATAVGAAVLLIIRMNKKQSANKHDEELPSLDDIGRRYLTSAATRDSYTGGDKTSDGLGFTLHYDANLVSVSAQTQCSLSRSWSLVWKVVGYVV